MKRVLELNVTMDEVPALAIKQMNLFVGCFVTIIPHSLLTTPFSRYMSLKAGSTITYSPIKGILGLGSFRF